MRIGLAVDGQAEVASLPAAREGLNALSRHTILFPPVLVPMNADVPPAAIAAECESRAGILIAKGIDLLIVLLDREQNQDCCGAKAEEIQRALDSKLTVPACVVIKNRVFENWLLSDLNALAASPARFTVSNALRGRVEPNKADHVDGLREIKAAVNRGGSYDKVVDAKRILQRANPECMGRHSRSFRRFLRHLGVPAYAEQSRNPA